MLDGGGGNDVLDGGDGNDRLLRRQRQRLCSAAPATTSCAAAPASTPPFFDGPGVLVDLQAGNATAGEQGSPGVLATASDRHRSPVRHRERHRLARRRPHRRQRRGQLSWSAAAGWTTSRVEAAPTGSSFISTSDSTPKGSRLHLRFPSRRGRPDRPGGDRRQRASRRQPGVQVHRRRAVHGCGPAAVLPGGRPTP